MNFNSTLPEWKNTGTEPSDTLKENGFVAGYKPPRKYIQLVLEQGYSGYYGVADKFIKCTNTA